VYSGEAIKLMLSKFTPDKLVLLKAEDSDPDTAKEIEKTLGTLQRAFPKVKFESVFSTMYDLVGITKTVVKVINAEKGSEVMLHVTEGRKTMMLGMLYAGYLKKNSILGAYYAIEENYNILQLPLPDFSISKPKRKILTLISQGKTPKEITNMTKKSPAIVYAHLKEMKKDGFITEENEMTDAGRIVLL
jgi:CRISPR-associated protein Csa3